MAQKRKHLREMYQGMVKMCHKPFAELIQDLEDTLAKRRSEHLFFPSP
jgi:tripartite motif-containing protein 43/48/49/64/77